MKILVALLVLSNIALGVFGVYVLRHIDKNYSALIAQAVPSLNELQTLTALSTDAMRSTNPILFAGAAGNRGELVKRGRLAIERDSDLRKHILQRPGVFGGAAQHLSFEEAGESFSQKAGEVITVLESGDDAAANRLREQSLRPSFDRYITATTKLADALQDESLRTSEKLTAQTGSMSGMILGLATWPMMIVAIFFVAAALFIVGVLIKVKFFQEAES